MARRKDKVSGDLPALRRDRRLTLEPRKVAVKGTPFDSPMEDFELRFLEGVVGSDPTHEEALMLLGHAYTERGDYRKGLQIDERLVQLLPENPTAFYNLACSLSLLKRIDEALDAVVRALELGFGPFSKVEEDPDLENLRRSPLWQDLLERRREGST